MGGLDPSGFLCTASSWLFQIIPTGRFKFTLVPNHALQLNEFIINTVPLSALFFSFYMMGHPGVSTQAVNVFGFNLNFFTVTDQAVLRCLLLNNIELWLFGEEDGQKYKNIHTNKVNSNTITP